ncbi:MAG: hypothetical protein M0Z58_01570 [Nitrospiraceae bacterium]|nr:hypothetical protein [Nitrospiraceae bacterium]
MKRISGAALIILITAFICGCGWKVDPTQQEVNSNLDINNGDPSDAATASGIWQGSYTISGQTYSVTGVIDAAGEARFALSDGVNFAGTVTTSNTGISGPFSVYDPDGVINGPTSLSGSFSAGGNMTAQYAAQAGNSPAYDGTLNVAYNSIYSNPAALSLIEGTWANDGLSFTITNGRLTGSDNQDGCSYSGNITVPSSANNIYRLSLDISGCGKAGSYNGMGFIDGGGFTYFVSNSRQAHSETLIQQ